MKSIANQYRDLKEGKMSQSNFMRNLRMSMPQYVTNVTSFNDAVKILRNKAILTEGDLSRDVELGRVEDDFKQLLAKGYSYSEALELIAQNTGMDPDELESMLPQDAVDTEGYEDEDSELDAMISKMGGEEEAEKAIKSGFGIYDPLEEANGEFPRGPETMAQAIADEFKEELLSLSGREREKMALSHAYEKILNSGHPKAKIIARNLVFGYADEDWPMNYISTLNNMLDKMEDDDISAMSSKMNELNEDRTDDELNQAFLTFLKNIYAKSPTEKIAQMIADQEAKMGISKEDTPEMPMFKGTRDALDDLSIREGRKKKEPKKELHPNQIHPGELRMGIRVEMEHTDDPKKAEKIALDHLAENPFYYTALKLSGIESPSAPKAKVPVAFKKEVTAAVELVDKANAMQKVKMPKVVKEVYTAAALPGEEINDTTKKVVQYIDSDIANPTLKALSKDISLQNLRDNRTLLRYRYWEPLPDNAIRALELQFKVAGDTDIDDDTAPREFYILSPKPSAAKNLGSSLETGADKTGKMDVFKEALEKLVREAIAETFDGRDNLANITDDTK